jgi:3-oxoadipate enol-lactonase
MPFANLPDVKIYYEWAAGAEHLPVVVFSNGLGTNLHMWDHQIEAFSQHFRVLRYDIRGHGQSGLTPGPYTIEQLSRDLVHLLDSLQLDRVYFCGLSMGGMTGTFLGANVPNRLHKLALCNTAAKFDPEHMWNKRIQAVQSGGMKAVAASVLERWLTPEFRATHTADSQKVLTMLESANPEGYVACCAAVRDMDQRDDLKKIHLPCLVVAGTYDPAAPPAAGQLLAKSIPAATYAELPASHLSNIEARDEFNRQVLHFLLA